MSTNRRHRTISPLALRGRHLLAIDLAAVAVAFILSFALRLDGPYERFLEYLLRFDWLVIPLLAIRIGTNVAFRLYQRLWRYAGVEEMQAVVLAVSSGSLAFGLLILALGIGGPTWPAYGFPRSIVGIEWLLSLALIGGSRFSLRALQAGRWVGGQRLTQSEIPTPRRVVIAGAGDAGAMVAKELRTRPNLGLDLVGFLDDDPRKRGHLIHGVRVEGSCADLPQVVSRLAANTVIVAMPSAPGTVIRAILQTCEEIGVGVMTVPGLPELISGRVAVSQIRPVEVEDLLRREPAKLDLHAIAGFLEGATVMVTGAGGSIGSELCRQILHFHPAQLLLLGRGENSIYDIQMELESRQGLSAELLPLIADVRDAPRIKALISRYRPSVIFHAAAHKHVPLMEANPSEAVVNNVFGTRNLLKASEEVGIERFVLVSTDKAVNPSSVMGATKRIAELLTQRTAADTGRPYVAVRFGNVLGSRGSVVPLFKRQIEAGGPVTVTDPQVIRYFMTIPEAVQLIIQAAAMGRGGEIFVLDMGEPVRIYDLARDLIRLCGMEPYRDIDIKITGLRPGEKLYEELFTPSEERVATRNSRIFISSLQRPLKDHLEEGLDELAFLVSSGCLDEAGLRDTITRLVPEFSAPSPRDRVPSLQHPARHSRGRK